MIFKQYDGGEITHLNSDEFYPFSHPQVSAKLFAYYSHNDTQLPKTHCWLELLDKSRFTGFTSIFHYARDKMLNMRTLDL